MTRRFDFNKPSLFGSELPPAMQHEALRRYVHRYTLEHVPAWARNCPKNAYHAHFKTDAEWLAATRFNITSRGQLAHADCYTQFAALTVHNSSPIEPGDEYENMMVVKGLAA